MGMGIGFCCNCTEECFNPDPCLDVEAISTCGYSGTFRLQCWGWNQVQSSGTPVAYWWNWIDDALGTDHVYLERATLGNVWSGTSGGSDQGYVLMIREFYDGDNYGMRFCDSSGAITHYAPCDEDNSYSTQAKLGWCCGDYPIPQNPTSGDPPSEVRFDIPTFTLSGSNIFDYEAGESDPDECVLVYQSHALFGGALIGEARFEAAGVTAWADDGTGKATFDIEWDGTKWIVNSATNSSGVDVTSTAYVRGVYFDTIGWF